MWLNLASIKDPDDVIDDIIKRGESKEEMELALEKAGTFIIDQE